MKRSLIDWFSVFAAVVVAALAILQILLAAGFPLGQAAFGGENQVLPKRNYAFTPSAGCSESGTIHR
jgi:hypothetical protein